MHEALPPPAPPGTGLAGLLALILAGMLSGCEGIRIVGGTSEVGNPVSAHSDHGAADTARTRVTGIGISTQGRPIRLVREEAALPAQDSVPVP
jgi:hypothetical protein